MPSFRDKSQGRCRLWGTLEMVLPIGACWDALLSNPAYTPLPANIAYRDAAFQELLRIRYSSGLFRMPAFNEVLQNLTFLNTGQNQTPALIVMNLDAAAATASINTSWSSSTPPMRR